MKKEEKQEARMLRSQGFSFSEITKKLGVAKSSVSLWVRDIQLTERQRCKLSNRGISYSVIEKRRATRLQNEKVKKEAIINGAKKEIDSLTIENLKSLGAMLYWAEGGKTQNMVRFSNSDPLMIKVIMTFFRKVCRVPEKRFRGYIHIHPHLDHKNAEQYWSSLTSIPLNQFFKTYRIPNKSSLNKRETLPYGTLDIYVCDTNLFLRIKGWIVGIHDQFI